MDSKIKLSHLQDIFLFSIMYFQSRFNPSYAPVLLFICQKFGKYGFSAESENFFSNLDSK